MNYKLPDFANFANLANFAKLPDFANLPNFASLPNLPGFEQYAAAAKANIEAYVACGTALSQGLEQMSKAWFGFANTVMEQSVAAAKAVTTAKSLSEVLDVQSDYARNMYDAALAEGNKVSELSLKVANDAAAPLSVRVKETWSAIVPKAA